jgi:hypothetical protein
MTAPTQSDIIHAQEAASFNVISVCNDLFGLTWHASYVRLVEVITTANVSDRVNLAYIVALTRGTADVVAAVSDSCLEPANIEDLRLLHSAALSELAEPDHDLNPGLIAALNAIDISLASNIQRVVFNARANPLNNHLCSRPRQEMLFNVAEKFVYFALHSES